MQNRDDLDEQENKIIDYESNIAFKKEELKTKAKKIMTSKEMDPQNKFFDSTSKCMLGSEDLPRQSSYNLSQEMKGTLVTSFMTVFASEETFSAERGKYSIAEPIDETSIDEEHDGNEENLHALETEIKTKLNAESFNIPEVLRSSEILYKRALYPDDSYYDIEKTETPSETRKFPILGSVTSKTSIENQINPFILRWSFGYNVKVPVLNLTQGGQKDIFFASAHKGILYNYEKKELRYIHGHSNNINSVSMDASGKWLLTSDIGEDQTIAITNTDSGSTVYTIYPTASSLSVILAAISPDGKALITVCGEDNPIIVLYYWTYGNDDPDDAHEINVSSGYLGCAVQIAFHPNNPRHVMIVFLNRCLFVELDEDNKKFLTPVITKRFKNVGDRTTCTYIENCHEAFSSTTLGYIIVYGTTYFVQDINEKPLDNNKNVIKYVKVSKFQVTCLTSVDGMAVTGDSGGNIQFYDSRIKLLYWIHRPELPAINSISFNLEPRKYKFENPYAMKAEHFYLPSVNQMIEEKVEDNTTECETLYANLVPSDITLQHKPFVARDFVVGAANGNIYFMDCTYNTFTPMFITADSNVASVDCSDELPYLVIAYENGRIILYNFESMQIIKNYMLPTSFLYASTDEESIPVLTTFIKYSPESLHLACGRSNGDIYFLTTIMESMNRVPIQHTHSKITKICFSNDSRYCAYTDNKITVLILRYVDQKWNFCGKFRHHTKQIVDVMFSPIQPYKLFTLGEDKYMVLYELHDSTSEWAEVQCRISVSHSTIPTCFLYNPYITDEENPYILVADNEQKIRSINLATGVCRSVSLGPTYGCYGKLVVNKMMLLPGGYKKYILFSNGKHIGIQILPPDGNPFKFVSVCGNPKLKDFAASYDGRYIFSFGENDQTVLLWELDVKSADNLYHLGGKELDPYYCLIEGGAKGWFFKEMQDIFCYVQILNQGEICIHPRVVSDIVPITEIADLMRACGFYPSESEIEDMLTEVSHKNFDKTGKLREDITFVEFVLLFINYRPAHGISIETLRQSFDVLCKNHDDGADGTLSKHGFFELITNYGEPFTTQSGQKCLAALMQFDEKIITDDGSGMCLPREITFDILANDILGILKESSLEQIMDEHNMDNNQESVASFITEKEHLL